MGPRTSEIPLKSHPPASAWQWPNVAIHDRLYHWMVSWRSSSEWPFFRIHTNWRLWCGLIARGLLGVCMGKSTAEYYRYLAVDPRDHVWGLTVSGAGYQPAAPLHTEVPRRFHPPGHRYTWTAGRVLGEFALVYVADGQGEFESQELGLVPLETGDAVLLFPGVWHRYRPQRGVGWQTYWVHFSGTTAEHLRAADVVAPERAVRGIGRSEADAHAAIVASFLAILAAVRDESPGFPQVAAARTLEILARVAVAMPAERPSPRLQDIVRRARLVLEAGSKELPVIEELIQRFGVSRSQFFRLFRKQTGHSPYGYHLQLSIRRAQQLLRDSDLTVQQISAALGFRSPFHFSRLFKRKTGVAPREFRLQWQPGAGGAASESRARPPGRRGCGRLRSIR